MAKKANALLQFDALDDATQYVVTITRPIMGLDGRFIRPGSHMKSIRMSGAVIKKLAADNPGAISGADQDT